MHKKGFTLIEVITVMIIAAGLAAIALPKFGQAVERMRTSEARATLIALMGAQKRYFLENGVYADEVSKLDVEFRDADSFAVTNAVYGNPGDPCMIVSRKTGDYAFWINGDGDIFCVQSSAGACSGVGMAASAPPAGYGGPP